MFVEDSAERAMTLSEAEGESGALEGEGAGGEVRWRFPGAYSRSPGPKGRLALSPGQRPRRQARKPGGLKGREHITIGQCLSPSPT
jgi:hypothetical protein